ncbi:MAG: M16 family metallopeptidase [Acidobacteriota bacterium]
MKKHNLFPIFVFFLGAMTLCYGQFFPYAVQKKTLENGMDVLVIETPEFKDVLSYNTLVMAGARNEIEKGKTGLAHLFEHILFRHRWKGMPNGYDEAIQEMGAFNNAWTFFDVTYYHPLTFASNLKPEGNRPGLAQLEADRFKNLSFTEDIFKTEAGAVLGEYRRIASDPGLQMDERLLALLFPDHSYGHSTIGYLEDVEDMPNEYQAALEFYQTYYRPNNIVLVVTGDVEAEQIFALAQELYGDWKPADLAAIPEPGPVGGPKKEHVAWAADVPPRISYSYRMPAFDPSSRESGVAELLPELLAGETAPLFQKLRYEKKTASALSLYSVHYESFAPRLLEVAATLFKDQYDEKGEDYLNDVISDINASFHDLSRFSQIPNAEKTLEELKRKYRYDLLAALNSPSNIAEIFALLYRFNRNPRVFDTLIAGIESVTPAHVETFAKNYFTEDRRVIVTMAPAGAGTEGARNE